MTIETAPFDLNATPDWWLAPANIFDGETIQHGQALRISAGRIATLAPLAEAGLDGAPVWHTDKLATPGYFDVQINGGGGATFNTDPTPEGLATISAAHRSGGTTAFLPTVITDVPEVMERAADAVIATRGRHGIVGIHIEGPHINVERKGAHNPAFIRPIDEQTYATVGRLRAAGVPTLLTLAPECQPAGSVARLVEMGVVVSIGHTAGDVQSTRAAIAEGAISATHLYNAMTPMTSRAPGVVGAVLDSDIYVGFIADGHHVDDAVLRLSIRSRPRDGRMVLVSDAMATWNGPDWFEVYGERITLKDGKLVNRIGSLAGVHFDMGSSVRRLVQTVGLSLPQVLPMATSIPARMIGLADEIGSLKPGARADILLLNDGLTVSAVIASA